MSFSYDVSTDVGMVRLLISDTQEKNADLNKIYLFEDAEIQAVIDRTDSLDLAAAQLFDIIAGSEAKLATVVRRGDISDDRSKVAAELRAQAAAIRERESADVEPLSATINPSYERFSGRRNELLEREDKVRS